MVNQKNEVVLSCILTSLAVHSKHVALSRWSIMLEGITEPKPDFPQILCEHQPVPTTLPLQCVLGFGKLFYKHLNTQKTKYLKHNITMHIFKCS